MESDGQAYLREERKELLHDIMEQEGLQSDEIFQAPAKHGEYMINL